MPSARLDDRAVIEIEGADARPLLDRLVTCEVATLAAGGARYGALLTPQGKIIGDFILLAGAGEHRFFLDTPRVCAADLVKRITLYRLRAKAVLTDRSEALAVEVGWDGAPPVDAIASAPDPRLAALGWRAIVRSDPPLPHADESGARAYHSRRIGLGVPEAIRDFAPGDAFPHEALMDQLGGVDFRKGCYVGQEVVSRMQHRGTARTRVVRLRYGGGGPHPVAEVSAGGRALGQASAAAGEVGLATVRLDRAAEALAAAVPILAGEAEIRFSKPDWVRFPYPGELAESAA